MNLLTFDSRQLRDAPSVRQVLEAIQQARTQSPPVVLVAAMGSSQQQLLDAARKAARQQIVPASTLAEGLRTYHMQLGKQLLAEARRKEAQKLISRHFEELYTLLQGIFLLGELTPHGETMVLSYGERATALILSQALQQREVPTQLLDDRRFYLASAPEAEEFRHQLQEALNQGRVAVIPSALSPLLEPVRP